MNEVKREFEEYVADLHAQLKAAEVTGALGGDDKQDINQLIKEYEEKIDAADSEDEARRRFDRFKEEAGRYAQGAGMP